MKQLLLILGLSLGLVGCSESPDVAMKIEKSPTDFTILMGSIENPTTPEKSSIFATDGEMSCDAKAIQGGAKYGVTKTKLRVTYDVSCSNGANGKVIFQGTHKNYDIFGAGIGKLSDGTKVKIIVGDAAGTIGW